MLSEREFLDNISVLCGISVPKVEVMINEIRKTLGYISLSEIFRICSKYVVKKPLTHRAFIAIYRFDKGHCSKSFLRLISHYLEKPIDVRKYFDDKEYLKRDFGESWVDNDSIGIIEKTLDNNLLDNKSIQLRKYSKKCWNTILTSRYYTVPERGLCEFKISEKFDEILGIEKIRFIQEDLNPPEVYVRVLFKEPQVIEIIKVCDDGSVQFCIGESWSDISKLLLQVCALGNYRDLVRAPDVYFYFPGIRSPYRPRDYNPKIHPIRYMPRKRYIPIVLNRHLIDDEQLIDDEYTRNLPVKRGPGHVVGHIRRLPEGYKAHWIKEVECQLNLGIDLPEGCTYVNEYDRGGSMVSMDGKIIVTPPEPSVQEELIYRSLFYSIRVNQEMNELIKYRTLSVHDLKDHFS